MHIDAAAMSTSSSGYGSLTRGNSSPKTNLTNAFGSTLTMYKEDHERERVRWQQKLDDTETRLSEAEIIISEMNQIKAELNKKIVEMERNQKPLIEQNRRLAERNRILQNEIKKGEQKLCHAQDGFLTLKGNCERLMKENQLLKDKRASPEKLEELDRYRNQVLECSKCITALRQSSMEKDRRYDFLLQKFKRIRKCILQRKGLEADEDLHSSFGGSDCSWDSTISLNTIAEDLRELLQPLLRINENTNEQLEFASDDNHNIHYLSKVPCVSNENGQYSPNEKSFIQSSEESLRRSPQCESGMYSSETVTRLQNQVISMQEKIDLLQAELISAKDTNELLEFQMLENNEDTKNKFEELMKKRELADKSMKTEDTVSNVDVDAARQCASTMDASTTKSQLSEMAKSSNLDQQQRAAVIASRSYIDSLEKTNARIDRYILQLKEKELLLTDLRKEIQNLRSRHNVEKQQQAQIKKLEEQIRTLTEEKENVYNELGKLREVVTQKEQAVASVQKKSSILLREVDDMKAKHSKEKAELCEKVESTQAMLEALKKEYDKALADKKKLLEEAAALVEKLHAAEDQIEKLKLEVRPTIKSDLERRFEETRYRVQCAVEDKHELEREVEALKEEISRLEAEVAEVSVLRAEVEEHREYADQLEKQFSAQVTIIDALKKKLLEQRAASGVLPLPVPEGNLAYGKQPGAGSDTLREIRGSDGI